MMALHPADRRDRYLTLLDRVVDAPLRNLTVGDLNLLARANANRPDVTAFPSDEDLSPSLDELMRIIEKAFA